MANLERSNVTALFPLIRATCGLAGSPRELGRRRSSLLTKGAVANRLVRTVVTGAVLSTLAATGLSASPAGALTGPAGAVDSSWQTATQLTGSGIRPLLGVDARGIVQSSWVEYVPYNSKPTGADHQPGGPWATPAPLTPYSTSIGARDFAVNADGDAILAWSDSYSVTGVSRSAGGPWSSPVTLAPYSYPDHLSNVQVALDDDGNAVVAWQRNTSYSTAMVQGRLIGSDGTMQPVADFVASPRNIDSAPTVAFVDTGQAMVGWGSLTAAPSYTRFQASVGSFTTPWSAPHQVAFDTQDMSLGSNADGTVVATWHGIYSISAAVYSAGAWGSYTTLGNSAGIGSLADIGPAAVAANGGATALWSAHDGSNWLIRAASFEAGAWTSSTLLSSSANGQAEPTVSGNPAGDVVTSWRELDGTHTRIAAAVRPAGSSWPASYELLSAADVDANSITVAIDDLGLAVAAWVEGNGLGPIKTTFSDSTPPAVTITTPSEGRSYNADSIENAEYTCSDDVEVVRCAGDVANGTPFDTNTVGPASFTVTARDRAGNATVNSTAFTITEPPVVDADGDGVDDNIDTGNGQFNDGGSPPTFGQILDDAGLNVRIEDSPVVGEGVKITVSGTSATKAILSICGFTIRLTPGTESFFTCGSVLSDVVKGQVEVVLGGGVTVVTIPTGGTAKVTENTDGSYAVDNQGEEPVTVSVNGSTSTVPAGDSSDVQTWLMSGFSAPVARTGLTTFKAGSTVPLKWTLKKADGTPVTGLTSATITVSHLDCGLITTANGPAVTLPAKHLGSGEYQVDWKTRSTWKNSCKVMSLDLGGGVARDASFKFRA